jgi:hypothetical protein
MSGGRGGGQQLLARGGAQWWRQKSNCCTAVEEKQRHGGWSRGRRKVGQRRVGCSFFLDEYYLNLTLYNLSKKGG